MRREGDRAPARGPPRAEGLSEGWEGQGNEGAGAAARQLKVKTNDEEMGVIHLGADMSWAFVQAFTAGWKLC